MVSDAAISELAISEMLEEELVLVDNQRAPLANVAGVLAVVAVAVDGQFVNVQV